MRNTLVITVLLALLPSVAWTQEPSDAATDEATTSASDVAETAAAGTDESTAEEADEAANMVESATEPAPAVVGGASAPRRLLLDENAARARTNRFASFVLGGWAVANLTWATVGLVGEPEDRRRGFHLSNAAVNVAVAGVAVTTYFSNLADNPAWDDYDAIRTLSEAHATEKLALFSAALDLAYIATGAFLTAEGNLKENEGMIGIGKSLMLQGAFLCAFDLTTFTFHALRRGKFVQALGAE